MSAYSYIAAMISCVETKNGCPPLLTKNKFHMTDLFRCAATWTR